MKRIINYGLVALLMSSTSLQLVGGNDRQSRNNKSSLSNEGKAEMPKPPAPKVMDRNSGIVISDDVGVAILCNGLAALCIGALYTFTKQVQSDCHQD